VYFIVTRGLSSGGERLGGMTLSASVSGPGKLSVGKSGPGSVSFGVSGPGKLNVSAASGVYNE